MIVLTHHAQCACQPRRFFFVFSSPSLPPAHLLWVVYKSPSQEECQSVRCQSEPRLPFHLAFLPVTEERDGRGEEEGAQLHYQHTHTLATLQCGSGAGAQGSLSTAGFPPLSYFLIVFCDFCFNSSSFERLWGYILKHESVSLCRLLKLCFPTLTHPPVPFRLQTLVRFCSATFPPATLKDKPASSGPPRKYLSHFYKCTVFFFTVESFLLEHIRGRALTETSDEILTRGLSLCFCFFLFCPHDIEACAGLSFWPFASQVFWVWVPALSAQTPVVKRDADSSHISPVASVKTHRQRARTPLPPRVTHGRRSDFSGSSPPSVVSDGAAVCCLRFSRRSKHFKHAPVIRRRRGPGAVRHWRNDPVQRRRRPAQGADLRRAQPLGGGGRPGGHQVISGERVGEQPQQQQSRRESCCVFTDVLSDEGREEGGHQLWTPIAQAAAARAQSCFLFLMLRRPGFHQVLPPWC